MLTSRELNASYDAVIVAPPSQVVPYTAPTTPSPASTSTTSASASSFSSTVVTVPRSVYVGISIAGLIGAIGIVSWKYCPWWNQRRWRRAKDTPASK